MEIYTESETHSFLSHHGSCQVHVYLGHSSTHFHPILHWMIHRIFNNFMCFHLQHVDPLFYLFNKLCVFSHETSRSNAYTPENTPKKQNTRKSKKKKRDRVINVWNRGFKKVWNRFDTSAAHILPVLGRCLRLGKPTLEHCCVPIKCFCKSLLEGTQKNFMVRFSWQNSTSTSQACII